MHKSDLYNRKFSVIQELSSAILITDNVNAIANVLLQAAINYTHADRGSLMLVLERDELSIQASAGLSPETVKSTRVKIGDGIAGKIAGTGQAVLVEDIDKEEDFNKLKRDHYKTKSFISCPIISKKKLLGMLNINDKQDGSPFTIDDFEVLTTLANHAAIALENAHLMAELKSKASALEDVNKKLIETDILKTEFLTRVSHELRTPLNSLKGAIYFLEHSLKVDQQERQEFYGIISGEVNKLVSIVENLLGFLRMEDEAIIVKNTVINLSDIFNELREFKSLKNALTRRGIRLNLDIQNLHLNIIGDKIKVTQLFANLIDGLAHFLERGDSLRIAAEESSHVTVSLDLSRPLPEHALSLLHDAHYIFQMDHPDDKVKLHLAKNIIESHHWQLSVENTDNGCRVMLAIPKSAKQTIDTYVNQSMDSFVEFISDLLDLDICSIMLTDEISNELTVKSAVGLDDTVVKKTKIKFGDKIAGWVALEGKPLFIENIENDARFAKASISQYSTKSLVSLPLKVGDRVVGVLNLNNKKTSEPFTKQDYMTATRLGEKISQFLELLYSENCDEEKLRELFSTFESLVKERKFRIPKEQLVPALTNKILKTPLSFRKSKIRSPAS